MRLKALDQIHISAVKADTLRPREEFEVSDTLGRELLEKHPRSLAIAAAPEEVKAEPKRKVKADPDK